MTDDFETEVSIVQQSKNIFDWKFLGLERVYFFSAWKYLATAQIYFLVGNFEALEIFVSGLLPLLPLWKYLAATQIYF